MAMPRVNYEPITYPNRLELVMSEHETEWIETSEAAEIMGVELSTVSALCRKGTINCRQYGKGRRSIWEVDKASAMTYQKSVGGRPKKKK